MKKEIVFLLLITGAVGFGLWQTHVVQHSGAGVTRPTEMAPTQKPSQSRSVVPLQSAEIQAVSEFEQTEGKKSLPPMLNSDEAVSSANRRSLGGIEAYVNSAQPGKISEYYATLRVARAELVQNQLNQESQDPVWSKNLAARLAEAYRLVPGLPELKLSKSDCRETICALHVDMKKGAYKQYARYMQHIGTVLGADTWVHHDALPDTAIIYVARVDTELPKLGTN